MSISGPDQGAAGGANFGAMLALMSDPAALKAKYAEFEKNRQAAEAIVKLVGPAQDVLRLQSEAQADRKAAGEELAKAKASAQAAMASANASAADIIAKAQAKAAELADAAAKLRDAAGKAQRDAQEHTDSLNKQGQMLEAKGKDLMAQAEKVHADQVDLTTREIALGNRVKTLEAVRDAIVAQFAEHLKKLKA